MPHEATTFANPQVLAGWPAERVDMRPVAALALYSRNARTHSPAQVDQIAASIREWGWTVPILVDEAGTIIAGHGRVLAARKLGIVEVPVMVAHGWTEAQKRAYTIADNQLALNAAWDGKLLAAEISDLKAGGFDLGLIGFSARDLRALSGGGGLTDPDDVPEPPAEPVAKPGDVWQLGRHRLVCGDSTDEAAVRAALADSRPHLMVTDPPYGVEYDADWRNHALRVDGSAISGRAIGKVTNDDRVDWREAWALFPGDVAYVWHGALHAAAVAESLEASGFAIRSQVIWAKPSLVIGRGDYHWQHEPCWYAVRKTGKGHWAGDRKQTTLWAIANMHRTQGNVDDGKTNHSTQKPIECMRRPIENNSREGDVIYEPFSGSGTTIIAAEMTGRACHAIEIDPAYVDVAVERWQRFTGKQAVRL